MSIAESKITSQGQISVPAEIRRRLGVGPGSVLEWDQEGETVVVRRSGRYTSEEICRALFPKKPRRAKTLDQMKEGIRRRVRERHARR